MDAGFASVSPHDCNGKDYTAQDFEAKHGDQCCVICLHVAQVFGRHSIKPGYKAGLNMHSTPQTIALTKSM